VKLSRIQTTACRAVPDGEYSFQSKDGAAADLVVVTGASGSGKTSFLELILACKEVIGPYVGLPQTDDIMRPNEPGARVDTEWSLTQEEAASVGLPSQASVAEVLLPRTGLPTNNADPGITAILSKFSTSIQTGIVDYFPDDRSLPTVALNQDVSEFEMKRSRLDRGARKYEATAVFARKTLGGGIDPDGRGKAIRHILGELVPHLTPVGVNGRGVLEFHRAGGASVSIDRLSASERQILLFAVTPVMLGAKDSIIVIDMPELFLAKGQASRLLQILRTTLPPNQWIVATHDEGLISEAQQSGALISLGS
jgi:energy-coupling factor transporter ATP-binding protein EcfA2